MGDKEEETPDEVIFYGREERVVGSKSEYIAINEMFRDSRIIKERESEGGKSECDNLYNP